MTFLTDLTHNSIFMSAITGWFVAQVLKTSYPYYCEQTVCRRTAGRGRWNAELSFRNSMCTCNGNRDHGMEAEALNLPLAAVFAIVVMYDAMGVRQGNR